MKQSRCSAGIYTMLVMFLISHHDASADLIRKFTGLEDLLKQSEVVAVVHILRNVERPEESQSGFEYRDGRRDYRVIVAKVIEGTGLHKGQVCILRLPRYPLHDNTPNQTAGDNASEEKSHTVPGRITT